MHTIGALMNDVRIRTKLFLSYVLVVFVPVLTVGLLLTNTLKENSFEHALQQSSNNVEKIKRQAAETLQIHENVSNTIFFDRQLKEIVAPMYESDLDVYRAYRNYAGFTTYLELYKDISSIRFYSDNPTLLENWSIFRTDDTTVSSSWFQDGLRNRGKIVWDYVPDPTRGNEKALSLVRQVFYPDMTYCGMLVIAVHPDKLHSIVKQEPYETLIYTARGEIVASTDGAWSGQPLHRFLQTDEGSLPKEGPLTDIVYRGKPAKLIVTSVSFDTSADRVYIASVIPEDAMLEDARRTIVIAYWIIGSSLFVACVLIAFFSAANSRRLGILSRDLRHVARGDFRHRSSVSGNDEIGQLSRHFNSMVDSIGQLVRQVREAVDSKHALELKHREIRFKMLANQVNPHFLFNVLETLRMRAHCNGDREFADIVSSLGALFRNNLEIGPGPVSLASELELIRMYLDIQHFRFGDKLMFRVPSVEEVGDIGILPLLLQPIVENAVVHGIERKMGAGRVDVCVVRESTRLLIVVRDDGVGIGPDKLSDLRRTLDEPEDEKGQRIGLRNVHQRVKMYYGSEYGLHIDSRCGSGTTVVLALPNKGAQEHV